MPACSQDSFGVQTIYHSAKYDEQTFFGWVQTSLWVHGLRTHDGYIPNYLQAKLKSQSQMNMFGPKKYIWIWKLSFFCRNNGWLIENMDKGLTVPKWVLINWPKIPQMPQNYLSAQFVCPSQKVLNLNEKGFIGRP